MPNQPARLVVVSGVSGNHWLRMRWAVIGASMCSVMASFGHAELMVVYGIAITGGAF